MKLSLPLQNTSPKRILVRQSGPDKSAAKFGRHQVVLSRALCLFHRFDFRDIPAKERHLVANSRVNRWSPYIQTGKWLCWDGGMLNAWIWDQSILDSGINSTDVVPETLLYAYDKNHPVRVVRCLDGFEGQIWTGSGKFLAGQWWPHAPDEVAWHRFCRKAGVELLPQPEPVDVEFLSSPWSRNVAMRHAIRQRRRNQLVWAAILVVGMLVGDVLGANLRLRQYYSQNQQENEKLIAKVEPVFKAREQALADSQASQILLDLWPSVRQIEVMAEVADKLPRDQAVQFGGWHYGEGLLRIVFMAEDPDAGKFVRAFQDATLFTEVSVEPDNQEKSLTLRMQIAEKEGK